VAGGGENAAVGNEDALRRTYSDAEVIDCGRGVLLPGLVDSHTHAIFGKARFEEQEMRAAGYDYMDIARRGGGIHASVRDLRSRSEDELVALALPRLGDWPRTAPPPSRSSRGAGLRSTTSSRACGPSSASGAPSAVTGPDLPGGARNSARVAGDPEGRADYVDLIVKEMIPRVVEGGLAQFADVFCEPGVFTLEETRAVLSAARAAGLRLKLHADELRPSGGAELAAQLGATSADHLAAISEPGVRALAASATVATMLPGTMLFLGKERQAPARALIDGGAAVALATDFNPGTSPTPNFPLILALAVSQLHLSVSEAVIAATVNGAAALALAEETGQLAPGYSADLALFDIEDVRELPYWYGDRRCRATWVRGVPCAA
jgi:imidazolonepropionase